MVGDIATQGERLQGVLSWRDSRATSLFTMFTLSVAVTLYLLKRQLNLVWLLELLKNVVY